MKSLGTPITDWLEKHGDPEIEKQVEREADEFPVPCPSCNATGIKVDFDRREVSQCSLCRGEKKVKYGLVKLHNSFLIPVVNK